MVIHILKKQEQLLTNQKVSKNVDYKNDLDGFAITATNTAAHKLDLNYCKVFLC